MSNEPTNWSQKLKFNYPRTMLIGLAFFAISLFWQVYYYVVPLILKQHIASETVVNIFMATDNALALIMLPIIGALSDRTRTRFGRRMPYIMIGTLAAAVMFALVALGDILSNLPLILTALLLAVISMSAYRSPAVALMPDLTPKPLRSKGNAIINIMGVIGGIIGTMVLVPIFVQNIKRVVDGVVVTNSYGDPLYDYHGTNPLLFVIVAIIMISSAAVLFHLVKESRIKQKVDAECAAAGYDEEAEEQRAKEQTAHLTIDKRKKIALLLILSSIFLWFMGYTAITTAASRYGYAVWGSDQVPFALTVAQGLAFLGAIPAGFLGGKIGRKWTIMIGIALLAIAFASLAFFTAFSPLMFGFFALVGIGWIFINVNSYPMVVELARGPDIGRYTGYYYLFSMSAQLLTKFISGPLLDHFGFGILFPYGAIFVAASFVTMLFVFDRSRPTPTPLPTAQES